ncbi:MAG: hypothetical protein ACAI35_26195, partial [Candidatus Methylacidiphilales bacterium]
AHKQAAQREAFAQLCIAELTRLNVPGPIEYDADEFRLIVGTDKQIWNLVNIEAEHRQGVVKLPELITNFVKSVRDFNDLDTDNFESIRGILVPTVRERVYFEFTRLSAQVRKSQELEVPFRPLSDSLIVSLALDTPRALRFITQKDLDSWSMSFEEVFMVAVENLAEKSPGEWYQAEGVYIGNWEDCNSPARMVLAELIHALPVKGLPVALVPNRNYLIITGSQDIEGQKRAMEIMQEALGEPRPMSGRPLILRDERWHTFFPQYDTPLYDDYQRLYMGGAQTDYGEQKDLLTKLHEEKGEDIYIASFGVLQNTETRQLKSWCAWTKGVVSLLPCTDSIMFLNPEQGENAPILEVRWNDAIRVFAHLMKKDESLYPERWLVDSFPEEEALKAVAVKGDSD